MKRGGFNVSGLSKLSELSKQIPDLSKGTELLNNAAQAGLGGINDKLNNAAQTGLAEGTNALNDLTQTVKSAVPTTTPIIGSSAEAPGTAATVLNPLIPETVSTNQVAPVITVDPGTAASNPSATVPAVSNLTANPLAPGISATSTNSVAPVVTAATTIFSFEKIIELIKGNIGKTIFITIFVITAAILIYIFVSPKSKKEGFFGASKKDETKEQNSKQVKIDEVERQLQERINNINTNLTSLKKRMDDADIVKDNKPTNLAIAIQNNILAVKEAMMKIIAGLVVQTKMNNGALSVVSQTNAFQQGINDSLSKFK